LVLTFLLDLLPAMKEFIYSTSYNNIYPLI
jgi:hypothetical protein